MLIHSLLRRHVLMRPEDLGSTGGGAIDATQAPSNTATPAAPEPAAQPSSMLEAIERGLSPSQPEAPQISGQPRDELGRFAPKNPDGTPATTPEEIAAAEAAEAAKAAPAEKPQPEDPLAPPDGLGPKASERFQKLANTVRELEDGIKQRDEAISYVKQTFEEHNIQKDQFEQAAKIIGAMNRGSLEEVEQYLVWQLQQIAIARGRPVAQIDPLSDHPDLRAAVSEMQLTEEHALQLARARAVERGQQQQIQQRQRQQHEAQQAEQQRNAEQQAVSGALSAIDAFTREKAASDMDWPAIEQRLLPRIQTLLQGVPPARWMDVVKTQYELIKDVAGGARAQPSSAPAQVLRATGQGSPSAAPKSMFEAMFPNG